MDNADRHDPALPRVLILEPDPAARDVFRSALSGDADTGRDFKPMNTRHAGAAVTCAPLAVDLVVCQGSVQALMAVRESRKERRPFAIAIVGVRDERDEDTACSIRALDAMVEIVLVPGPAGPVVGRRVLPASKRVVLGAPLRAFEVEQLARMLLAKWQMERQLRRAEARLAIAQRLDGVALWEWSPRTGEALWTPGLASLLGFSLNDCRGSVDRIWERIHREDRTRVRAELGRTVHDGRSTSLDYRIVDPGSGERRIRQESVTCPGDCDGDVWIVSAVTDLSAREATESSLRSLAYLDPLTQLPNRSFAVAYVRSAVKDAGRHERACAVLHVNLDGFKRINDILGHGAGDRVLQEVAGRLEGCVRGKPPAAGGGADTRTAGAEVADTIARFGADEFVIVLARVADAGDAERVAARVLERLAVPVELDGHELTISASIGIALFPEHAEDEDHLLRNAALAMQRAKCRGRNTSECYRSEPGGPPVTGRLEVEARLRRALESDGLSLHYQPKVTADGLRVCGAEALLRWHDETLGRVPPSTFIPIAEETGLILPLGDWVIRSVCAQIARWRDEGHRVVPVSVNVSAQQLLDHSLVRKVREALRGNGVSPDELEFEITESVLMGESDPLAQLRAMGSAISMDDFGTGYSSLSYLKRLPIDVVKIDRSFVQDILSEVDDQAILQAIITMAHQLSLRIVAEGVETEDQLELLRSMRCDLIQGYVVSPPVDAASFAERFLCVEHRHAV